MDELVIPPSSNNSKICVITCTPDNTLIYGSLNNIIILNQTPTGKLNVKIIKKAHNDRLESLAVNKNWGKPNKRLVSVCESNTLKIWDLESLDEQFIISPSLKSSVIQIQFATEMRIVGVARDGTIIVWKFISEIDNDLTILNLFKREVEVNCMAICPHCSWLMAIGLRDGNLVMINLSKKEILKTLKGDKHEVNSIAWCPAPVNIFPKSRQNIVRNRIVNEEKSNLEIVEQTESVELTEYSTDKNINMETENLNKKHEDELHEAETFPIECECDGNVDVPDESMILSKNAENGKETDVECEKSNLEEITESPVVIEEEPRDEYLLASSSSDGKIYIWRGGSDYRLQTFFCAPRLRTKIKHVFIVLAWPTPNCLLSSSKWGELLQWTLPRPSDERKQYKIIHSNCKGFTLWNIVTPLNLFTPYNWQNNSSYTVWTYGAHNEPHPNPRHKSFFWEFHCLTINNNEDKIEQHDYYTTNTVCSLAISPLDPNRVALGVKDGSIKMWDMSITDPKSIKMNRIYHQTGKKISCLAWHPMQEMILAFATEGAKVYQMNTQTNKMIDVNYDFASAIWKLEWAPSNKNPDDFDLYILSSNELFIWNFDRHRCVVLEENIRDIYTFAWKLDYELLLLSTKKGQIKILDQNLKLVDSMYLNENILRLIKWHPNSISDEPDVKYRHTFAATTTKGFFIYDYTLNDGNDETGNKSSIFSQYEQEVNGLSWNPFDETKILTITSDGQLKIWNILTKTTEYTTNFNGFDISDVFWSPINKNYLILVGLTVMIWKIFEQSDENKQNILTIRAAKMIKKKKKNVDNELLENSKKLPKNTIVPTITSSNAVSRTKYIESVKKLMANIDDPESKLDGDLEIFGNRVQILDLITKNQKIHKDKGKYNYSDAGSLWKGDFAQNLEEAVQEKRLNPWLLGLAPMVSMKMWQNCCEIYAEQLSNAEDFDPLEVAYYYLACHKLEKAITILTQNNRCREALALAKCRLPDNDELIRDITNKWASQCVEEGNFEVAAYCYVSVKNYELAAKVLSRRDNLDILKFAKELSDKSGSDSLSQTIQEKYDTIKNKEENVEDIELHSRFEAVMATL